MKRWLVEGLGGNASNEVCTSTHRSSKINSSQFSFSSFSLVFYRFSIFLPSQNLSCHHKELSLWNRAIRWIITLWPFWFCILKSKWKFGICLISKIHQNHTIKLANISLYDSVLKVVRAIAFWFLILLTFDSYQIVWKMWKLIAKSI